MPEAPEVQIIVNDLNRKIIGRCITNVWTDWPKMIKSGARTFEKEIKGAKIQKVRRRGKNILIDLKIADERRTNAEKRRQLPRRSALAPHRARSGAGSSQRESAILLIHQKMTGHLLVGKWSIRKAQPSPAARGIRKRPSEYEIKSLVKGPFQEKVNDFIHLIFYLDDGRMLGLSDMRKFAKVLFGPTKEIENTKDLKELGPDPLDSKTTFTDFAAAITKRSRPIKQVLMDQAVVSGIGNIYASDILWLAKIHPLKPANKLKENELKTLWSASKKVLKRALKLRGTSTADFRDTSGKKGRYGEVRLAYQRTGEPCRRCRTLIKRLKDSGRSAFYCPKCQKL